MSDKGEKPQVSVFRQIERVAEHGRLEAEANTKRIDEHLADTQAANDCLAAMNVEWRRMAYLTTKAGIEAGELPGDARKQSVYEFIGDHIDNPTLNGVADTIEDAIAGRPFNEAVPRVSF